MDPTKLHYGDPEIRDIGCGRFYYLQPLKCDGKDLYVASDWFRSDGIKFGLDRKPEMLAKVDGMVRNVLTICENEAIRQLKVPDDVLKQNNVNICSNELLYRNLYKDSNFLYAKLHRDCTFFNDQQKLIKRDELTYGEYRVVILVNGIYIGANAQNGKLASLQFRIYQIQFRKVEVQCLFDPVVGFVPVPIAHSTPISSPKTSANNLTELPKCPNAPKKPRRQSKKLSLQRQEALSGLKKLELGNENLQTPDLFKDTFN